MVLTSILSVSSIILGIYILIASFGDDHKSIKPSPNTQPTTEQQYHLGCYLTHQQITKYSQLRSKIYELQQSTLKMKSSIKAHPLANINKMQKETIQLARNFQMYLQQIEKEKDQRRSQVQLGKAVKNARIQYIKCSTQLAQNVNFDENQCQNLWQQYSKCSNNLQILQNRLSQKLAQKQTLTLKMKDLIKDVGTDVKPKPSQHDQIHRSFKIKADRLEDQQKRIQNQLSILLKKIPNAEYNLAIATNSTKHAHQLYLDCNQHRTQFRLCEELSQEVKGLGHGSIQSLGLKVQKKSAALNRIQKMLNQNTSGHEAKKQLSNLYHKQFEEYIKLHRLYIETKAKLGKHCGCSEKQEQKFKETYESKQLELRVKENQLNVLLDKKKQLEGQINNIKLQRQNLDRQYKKKLRQQSSSNTDKQEQTISTLEILKVLEQQDKQLQPIILAFQSQFQILLYDCQLIKNKLTAKIGDIDSILNCTNRKEYYQKIAEQYKKLINREDTRLAQIKKSQKFKQILHNKLKDMKIIDVSSKLEQGILDLGVKLADKNKAGINQL